MRTITLSPASWRRIPAASCERPAFWTQTNSTVGVPGGALGAVEVIEPRCSERCGARAEQRRPTAGGEQLAGLGQVALDRLAVEEPR